MTVAISKALEEEARAVVCASTGNTAASAAAYAARAGLAAVVLQPAGAVALGKLSQALALGARVLEVRGSFDAALAAARELARRGTHALVNSLDPYRLEGQKTAAFEIVEELGRAPDVLAPRRRREHASVRAGFRRGGRPRGDGRLGDPDRRAGACGRGAAGPRADGRAGGRRSPKAILEAWRWLALEEGLFCEPASAAGLAALAAGASPPGSLVVCVVTGHGLKDPEAAARLSSAPVPVGPRRAISCLFAETTDLPARRSSRRSRPWARRRPSPRPRGRSTGRRRSTRTRS